MLERFNCVSSNTNTNKVSDYAAISGGAFKRAILILFKNTNTNANERLHGSKMNLQRKIHFFIFKKKKYFPHRIKNLQKNHKFTQLNRKDKFVFIKYKISSSHTDLEREIRFQKLPGPATAGRVMLKQPSPNFFFFVGNGFCSSSVVLPSNFRLVSLVTKTE